MRVRSAATVLTLALGVAGCASTAQRPADITQLSVVDAAQLIRDKKVTSVELTQAYWIGRGRWPRPSGPTPIWRPGGTRGPCTACRSS